MCFYVVTPSGAENSAGNKVTGTAANELTLLSCTSTPATVDAGGVRTFKYVSSPFDPDAKYGTFGKLSVVVIGNNAAGDALVATTAATITLTN